MVPLAGQHAQILRRVVAAVAALVVDDFTRGQRPPQHLLGNQAVKANRLALLGVPDSQVSFARHDQKKRPEGR